MKDSEQGLFPQNLLGTTKPGSTLQSSSGKTTMLFNKHSNICDSTKSFLPPTQITVQYYFLI